jgi:hypothetical protein
MTEIRRVEDQPVPQESRQPLETPEEQRNWRLLASDANGILVKAAGTALGTAGVVVTKKILNKIRGGSGPPDAGQSGRGDAAPPEAE